MSEKLHQMDPADKSLAEALNLSLKILKGIMVLLVILFLSSGVFIVEQHEAAMVMRFGKIVGGTKSGGVLQDGLHWALPFPISEVIKIPIKQQTLALNDFWYKEEHKERSPRSGRARIPEELDPEQDGYCLTKDANIVHIEKLEVRYKITNPYLYTTKHMEPDLLLKNTVCSVMIKKIGQYSAHDVRKTTNEIIKQVQQDVQQKMLDLQTGMNIEGITLRIVPPRQVKQAFESVLQAEAEKDKEKQKAQTKADAIENEAEGKAADIRAKANNYSSELKERIQSDAKYFNAILKEFRKHPEIFSERYYQQAIEEISQATQEIFILSSSAKEREIHLHINRDRLLYKQKAPKEMEK